MINFTKGHPNPNLLPAGLVEEALSRVVTHMRLDTTAALQYGDDGGDWELRNQLADYHHVNPEHLLITAGIAGALQLLATADLPKKSVILVEEVSFFGALQIFSEAGLSLIPVKMKNDGMCLTDLENKLQNIPDISAIYHIPTCHNPTGITTSIDHRLKLLKLATQYNVKLLTDEVYHLLQHNSEPVKSFIELADEKDMKNLYSLHSFSKSIAPGIRIGYIYTAPENIGKLERTGLLRSGGMCSSLSMTLIRTLLENRQLLERHFTELNYKLRQRYEMMSFLLKEQGVRFIEPAGGYFIWCDEPLECDQSGLKNQISYSPAKNFYLIKPEQKIRLCFSHVEQTEMIKGIRELYRPKNESLLIPEQDERFYALEKWD